ncbi:Uncharacterised protein [Mycobacterium tuberculosis]|uniref:Uncharacterized protein n=1 Tax=Mycobacterium tuberculosis TaxID=1773 RepID=A0A0T9ESR0_MYCTX|nr:Uncharacterised protein [Mycobacterium tuberculosis]CFE49158.1 Uncharacterised protein [Mycobacterium tuberculosis]CFR74451.1 Uncharacterised protein [Mycobacterium tuberculosis]CKT38030.1 Uncharacterised protein [Mycobacterium tuberculosis]COV19619.1 Uncharacterised protein [Mycobacterium tuberculosis]
MLSAQALQHVDRAVVVDGLVALAPPAQHCIAGGDDKIADAFVAGHPLRQRRGTEPDPSTQFRDVNPA